MTSQITHDYYLLFRDAKKPLANWFRRGFSHVSIIDHDSYEWVGFNPNLLKTEWQAFVAPMDSTPFDYTKFKVEGTLLKVTVSDDYPWQSLIGLKTCVFFVENMMGIRTGAITPWQLYKRLTKRGSKIRNVIAVESK